MKYSKHLTLNFLGVQYGIKQPFPSIIFKINYKTDCLLQFSSCILVIVQTLMLVIWPFGSVTKSTASPVMYSTPRETAFFLKAFSKDHGSNQPSLPVPEIFGSKYHCRHAARACRLLCRYISFGA